MNSSSGHIIGIFRACKTYYDKTEFFLFFSISIAFLILNVNFNFNNACWDITYKDPADYVYLAQHFWHVPHTVRCIPDFTERFQEFLTLFPFRQIGVGTFYLFLYNIFGDFTLTIGPVILKIMIAVSYAVLGCCCSRRADRWAGIVCLIILLVTTDYQNCGNALWSEPFLRMLFIFYMALLLSLQIKEKWSSVRMILGSWILCLFVTHIKVQWMVLGLIILTYQAWRLKQSKQWKHFILVITLTLLIPISLLFVNWTGWHYSGFIAGNSLHTMEKHEYYFLMNICKEDQIKGLSPRFCNEQQYDFETWGQFFAYQYPNQDIKKLILTMDQLSIKTQDYSLEAVLKSMYSGAVFITNFPYIDKSVEPWGRFIDIIATLLCFSGLFVRSFRPVNIFCLSLWLIPLILYHFAIWDLRYMSPMAGLTMVAAFLTARYWFIKFRHRFYGFFKLVKF